MLDPELVQLDRTIALGEHPVTHSVHLVSQDKTDRKVVQCEGLQGSGSIRLLERDDQTARGSGQRDRLERVFVATPWHGILCPECALVNEAVVSRRRESCEIDVRGTNGIGRSKDRTHVMRRPDVLGKDSQRMGRKRRQGFNRETPKFGGGEFPEVHAGSSANPCCRRVVPKVVCAPLRITASIGAISLDYRPGRPSRVRKKHDGA